MPTSGYRRVHALLRRQDEKAGPAAPNAKRVYRVMELHDRLLQRHSGRREGRRHDGRIGVYIAASTNHGLLGLVGVPPTPDGSLTINLAALITYGHRIHGIIEGDSDLDGFIPELVDHFRAGRFPIDRLTKSYPLAQINEAVAAQARGDCIKAVLIP